MELNTSLAPFVFENFLLFLPYCLWPLIWLGQTVRWRLERSFSCRSRPTKLLKLYTPSWNWGESCTYAARWLPAKYLTAWPVCGTSVHGKPSFLQPLIFLPLLASSLLFLLLHCSASPRLFPAAEGHTDSAHFSDNWKKWNCLTCDLKGVPRPCDKSRFSLSHRSAPGSWTSSTLRVACSSPAASCLTNLCCDQSSNVPVLMTRLLTLLFFHR